MKLQKRVKLKINPLKLKQYQLYLKSDKARLEAFLDQLEEERH